MSGVSHANRAHVLMLRVEAVVAYSVTRFRSVHTATFAAPKRQSRERAFKRCSAKEQQ